MSRMLSYGMETKGAGFGWARETTWGTGVAREDIWLPEVKDNVKAIKPLEERASIFCQGNAPSQHRNAFVAAVARGKGLVTTEFNYDGLLAILCNYFGDATVTSLESGAAFSFAFPDDVEPGKPLTLEILRHRHSLLLAGVDLSTLSFSSNDPKPLQMAFGVIAKSFSKLEEGAMTDPTGNWVTDVPSLPYHHKLEVDIGGGYKVLDFDSFELNGDKKLDEPQAHDGSSLTIRRPARSGPAEWRGKISRRYGEQDSTVMDVDGIYDEFLAGQTNGFKVKFTSTGALIAGSTYYKLTLECTASIIDDTGPETDGPGPRKEMIDFKCASDGTDPAVQCTVVSTEDPSAWSSNPLAVV